MGRVHLVGEATTGLDTGRRRGLRDLAIAVGVGAAIWIADTLSGGHIAGSVNALALRLADWYEDRRTPVVACEPGKPRVYTALSGVVLEAPQCWEVEVSSLFDREVHRFHDPEARAGTLSVSVEPIASDEDRVGFAEEFARMELLPGARVNGVKIEAGREASHGPSIGDASGVGHQETSVPDSLAERLLHTGTQAGAGPGEGSPSGATTTKTPAGPGRAFRIVEAGGLIGIPPRKGESARQSDGSYARRTWTWLLVGDRCAVRIVYAVRADWSDSGIVGQEFRRADALARSVKPAP